MKALLGATALCLVTLAAGTVPAAAHDPNFHDRGDERMEFGRGPHGEGYGRDMMRGGHHGMHHDGRGYGHHGWGNDRGHHGWEYGDRGWGNDRGHHGREYGDRGWGHGRGHHGWRDDDDHHMDRRRHHGGYGGMMGHGRRIDRVMELIEHYDRDGDGKVTQAEIDQGRADRLAEFDSDGNGTLSLQEYEALWLDAMRERMVDRFQAHDDDGDGEVTVEEFSRRTGHLVLRGDRNEDGAIGPEDLRRGDRGSYMMRRDWGGPMMPGDHGPGMMRDSDDDE